VSAMGNQIGSITDLMTQCLAAGRDDFHRDLAEQLQLALDQQPVGTRAGEMGVQSLHGGWF